MLLLDTCALLWLSTNNPKISSEARKEINNVKEVFVSSISAFEIGYKYSQGKINLPCDPEKWFNDIIDFHSLTEIPIDNQIAIFSTKLPLIHKDPCDRFIIATAKLMNLKIVTSDESFKEYGIEIII